MSPLLILLSVVMNLTSLMLSIMSTSLFMIWLCMEVSVFSFMLLLMSSNLFKPSTHPVKYFLFQGMASVSLLLSLSMLIQHQSLMAVVLLMKLGAAPFHLWLMSMAENLTLVNLIWVTIIQKVIPLRFTLIVSCKSSFIFIILLSYFLSIIHMILQTKLIKMMMASSVYTTPWVVMSFLLTEHLGWLFFFIYCMFQLSLVYIIYKKSFLPLKTVQMSSFIYDTFSLVMILGMSGFPPSPLFFLKLKIGEVMLKSMSLNIPLLFFSGASIVMYNYLNICMKLFTFNLAKLY